MAKKNRVITVRIRDPEIYGPLDRLKARTGLTDAELARLAFKKLLGQKTGPLIPRAVREWARKITEAGG